MAINYSIIDPSKYHTTDDARSMLNQNSILLIIFALITLLVIFFVVGSLWEYWKHKNNAKASMETMSPEGWLAFFKILYYFIRFALKPLRGNIFAERFFLLFIL